MAFDPSLPAPNARIVSAELRDQFNGLKALIDLQSVPIGMPQPYLKNFPGVPALPANWVECNGQVLSDAQSPLNGQTLPDLNGASGPQRFLRGASASGGTGGADTHVHDIDLQIMSANTADGGDHTSVIPTVYSTTGPSPASASLPSYYEVVWVMRVK